MSAKIDDDVCIRNWRQAFVIFASLELGMSAAWSGPDDLEELRLRVETLALLLALVPRVELGRLSDVVQGIAENFPNGSTPSIHEVRTVIRRILTMPVETALHGTPFQQRAAAAVNRRLNSFGAGVRAEVISSGDAAEDYRRCSDGIATWLWQLENEAQWTHMRLLGSDEVEIPISAAFVEMYTVSDCDVEAAVDSDVERVRRVAGRITGETHSVIDAISMVARTSSFCIVVGDPGSGKSTLIQWLARSVLNATITDFELPLVVKLGPYSLTLRESPDLTLLDYFFHMLGMNEDDWSGACSWLRNAATEGARFLLLLDGWDEVPAMMREAVQRKIEKERHHFTTIVTSRPTGFPRRLATGRRAEVYHIAGLTRESQRILARRYLHSLGRDNLLPDMLQLVESHPNLWEVGCNPFMLGLLTWAVASDRVSHSTDWTPFELYRLAATWVVDAATVRDPADHSRLVRSLDGLGKLSFSLLFDDTLPRYIFSADVLAQAIDRDGVASVVRSRFVSRIDMLGNFYAFLHATFQEYFAACHVESLGESECNVQLERSFLSASRGIVLEFVIGLRSATGEKCRALLGRWIQRRDRYSQVVYRVARLLAACPDRFRPRSLVKQICNELWCRITSTRDPDTQQRCVSLYARLDPLSLCRAAQRANLADQYVLDCIIANVPAEFARAEHVAELLDPQVREWTKAELEGGPSAAMLEENRRVLEDPCTDGEALKTAIQFAGAARDERAVPILGLRLRNSTLSPKLQEEMSTCIGLIGGYDAARVLVDLVIGDIQACGAVVGLARRSLQHLPGSRRRLDPAGRDAILRRIASTPIENPRQIMMLSALQGFPVKTSAGLLKHLAISSSIPSSIRFECLQVMESSLPDSELEDLLSNIVKESGEIEALLLAMAVQHRCRISVEWLTQRMCATARLPDKTMLLSVALAMACDREHPSHEAEHLLAETMRAALTSEAPNHIDHARAFQSALADATVDHLRPPSWIDAELCSQPLEAFVGRDVDVSAERVMLASMLLGRVPRPEASELLQKCLRSCLNRLEQPLLEMQSSLLNQVARTISHSLAHLDPQSLLRFPALWGPIDQILESLSDRYGWLVFDDQIVDSEGLTLQPPWDSSRPRPNLQHHAGSGSANDGASILLATSEPGSFDRWQGRFLVDANVTISDPIAKLRDFYRIGVCARDRVHPPVSQQDIAKRLSLTKWQIGRRIADMRQFLEAKFKIANEMELLIPERAGASKCKLSPLGEELMMWIEWQYPDIANEPRHD